MSILITFEGVEGSGKTTQMEMLKEHLEWKGYEVVSTREPGGTELGEKIRGMLLTSDGRRLAPWSELLLYEVCRAQLVSEIIKPAIEDEKIVLCDRFTDSTVVYQGCARGLSTEAIESLNKWVADGVVPAATIVIDCAPEVGLKRALTRIGNRTGAGREDRFEQESMEFHSKVREGYLKLAKQESGRIKVINGDRDIRAIHNEICGIIDGIIDKLKAEGNRQ